ncbi:MAG: hypothetical protein ABJA87_07115 [bacterium]
MTRVGATRTWLAGLTVVATLVAGCSSGSSAPSGIRDAKNVALKKDCGSASCIGTRSDAKYEIQLPKSKSDWNGTLVIWSHGYRNPAPIPQNPLNARGPQSPVDTEAEAAPTPEVGAALTGQGYAVAGSAFKTNGWDVLDAVAADEDLYSFFSSTFGTPKRVYLWGGSLGGLITETLAEKHPAWVSGVAPLCGVLGGTNLNLDLALDVAYMVKTLVYPQLKLTGFTSHEEAVRQWQAASSALVTRVQKGGAQGIADLLTIAAATGAPGKTQAFDGHDATSIGQAYAQSVITALGYGTWGRYDLEQRAGGNPSTNVDTDYSARIPAASRATIDVAAPGQLHGILARLEAGQRVSADAAARKKAETFGDPTGDITVPTLTLHTLNDPLVLVQNETVFANRVQDTIHSRTLLRQLFTAPPTHYDSASYGAGHCVFTKQELLGVIDVLNGWVRNSVYPGPAVIEHAFGYDQDTTPQKQLAGTATTGLQPLVLTAGRWPAKLS